MFKSINQYILVACLFASLGYSHTALADNSGHTLGEAKTKTKACSIALEKAEDATTAARIMKHHVNIGVCSCEEKTEVESWQDPWMCMVRYETVNVGRKLYN